MRLMTTLLILGCLVTVTACETQHQQRMREANQRYYHSLSPAERQQDEAAALQALGMALSGGPPMRFTPAPVLQLPQMPMPAMQPRHGFSCANQTYGNQTLMNCQ